MLIDFCLPVKNEEEILEVNVLRLLSFLNHANLPYIWRIIIIVNGSNDNSFTIAKKLEAQNINSIRVKSILKAGKGGALKKYFKESEADIFIFMDADLSTSLNDIEPLINTILNEKFDIAIGSRSLPNSVTVRPAIRKLISKLYNGISRLFLKHNFHDLQCGFKAFTSEVAHHIFPLLEDDNWFFDSECIILSKINGYKIKEIPVNWKESRYFKRKTHLPILITSWYFLKKTIALRKRIRPFSV